MNFYHLVNPSVAFHAAYPPIDVDGMIEINVIGSLVNAYPGDRWAIKDAVAIGVLLGGKLAVPVCVFTVVGSPDGLEERGIALYVFVA